MWRLLPVVACLLIATSVWAERLKVASWNLRNYLVDDRIVDGRYRKAYPKPEAEKAALRAVILAERPDVLLIQEIGDERFLEELQRDLTAAGLEYPHTAWLDGPDETRHLAALSRLPWHAVRPHAHLPIRHGEGDLEVKRGLLELVFEFEGREWSLFTLHLKSRFTSDPADPQSTERRNAEARAVRELISTRLETDPEAVIVVGGDFNDGPRSRPLARFLGINGRPLLKMTAAVDERGDNWTHHYAREGVYSQIDFFLVSPGAEELVVPGSARVVESPEVRRASDHRMLVLELQSSARSEAPSSIDPSAG